MSPKPPTTMIDSYGRIVAVSLVLLTVFGAISALPAIALEPDSGSTYANPPAPGATAEYRVTVVAGQNDSVTRNGLKRVTLNYDADPDFSGSVAGVTARDVEVRITPPDANGSVPAGPVDVSTNPAGDRLVITLTSAYQNVRPGSQISVRVDNVRNTEIAIPDPQGLRGFALDVTTSDPQGNTDGPVEVRYTIDPNATAPNATGSNVSAPNASASNTRTPDPAGGASTSTSTDTGTLTAVRAGATDTATATETTTESATATEMTAEATTTTTTAAEATTTGAIATETATTTEAATTTKTTTEAATTETTTTAEATATETTTDPPASTAAETAGGGQATETTGPGFGLLAAVIALLAVALLTRRRRD